MPNTLLCNKLWPVCTHPAPAMTNVCHRVSSIEVNGLPIIPYLLQVEEHKLPGLHTPLQPLWLDVHQLCLYWPAHWQKMQVRIAVCEPLSLVCFAWYNLCHERCRLGALAKHNCTTSLAHKQPNLTRSCTRTTGSFDLFG
jgi:hypothetical protein